MCCLLIRTESDNKKTATSASCCSKEKSKLLSHLSYKKNKTDISLNYV